MAEIDYGAALFSDTHQHHSGWGARASLGGEPVYINGTSDLIHSDVVWITNLGYDLMFKAGFAGQARFRQEDYLGWHQKDIFSRIGLELPEDGKAHETPERASALAVIFGRVMRLAEAYGLGDIPPPKTLGHGLRGLWFDDDPILPNALVSALREAAVWFIHVERNGGAPEERARLWLSPVAHASRVVSLPVPWREWRHARRSELPKTRDEVPAWLEEVGNTPTLVRIRIETLDPSVGPIINFGSGAMVGRRSWVFAQELNGLAPYATVRISDAWIASEPVLPPAHEILSQWDERAELSVSAALFAASCWRAVEKSQKPPPHKLRDRASADEFLKRFLLHVRTADNQAFIPEHEYQEAA